MIRDIMEIRTATIADLAQIAAVEAECFPAAEAATKEEFEERIKYYGNHFWLMFEGEKLIAFVDGFVTIPSTFSRIIKILSWQRSRQRI